MARWSRDDEDGVRVERFAGAAINLKYGLSDSSDLQFIVEPYVSERVRTGSATAATSGIGDTTIRWKVNMRGNDSDNLAWALMPFVKLPTARDALGNGRVEGGLILPVAFDLNARWGCGLIVALDGVRDEADDNYRMALVTTATVATEIARGVGVFLELANEATETSSSDWVSTFNSGLTLALSPDRQLDLGANLGLTDAADAIAFFLGYSSRW